MSLFTTNSLMSQKLESKLEKHVTQLAKLDRRWNSAELEKAALYIEKELKKQQLKVGKQIFSVEGKQFRNIYTEIGPKDKSTIVIGAHYDTCLAQGADDNASGVAAILELAGLLKSIEAKLKHRFILVAWPLEEPPFFASEDMGSFHHAKFLKQKNTPVELMISLEMLGYYSDEVGSQKYPLPQMSESYPNKGNFIAIIGRPFEQKIVTKVHQSFKASKLIPTESLVAPPLVTGVDFSDHRNYWIHGYNAIMITDTAFLRNPNYHQPSDTPDTLNYKKMAAVVKSLFKYLQD